MQPRLLPTLSVLVLVASAVAVLWRAVRAEHLLFAGLGGGLLAAGLAVLVALLLDRRQLPSELASALRARESYEASVQSAPRLGELLLHKHRLISARELERALTYQRRTGQRLGAILVRMRAITPEQLTRVLVEQRLEAGSLPDPLVYDEEWSGVGDRVQSPYRTIG